MEGERKKDEDGLAVIDGATTQLNTANSALASGFIAAAVYQISSNETEPGNPPFRAVFHGFSLKDIWDELTAAVYQISSNVTEPGNPPFRAVFHGFSLKVIWDELTAAVDTTNRADISGITARVFTEGLRGKIAGCEIYEDGNLTIDSDGDAKGGVFAQEAIVLVQGRSPRTATIRREDIGGGATVMYLYDEYAYGERSAGNWLFEIIADATAPTS